jgi:hypothetical protein
MNSLLNPENAPTTIQTVAYGLAKPFIGERRAPRGSRAAYRARPGPRDGPWLPTPRASGRAPRLTARFPAQLPLPSTVPLPVRLQQLFLLGCLPNGYSGGRPPCPTRGPAHRPGHLASVVLSPTPDATALHARRASPAMSISPSTSTTSPLRKGVGLAGSLGTACSHTVALMGLAL